MNITQQCGEVLMKPMNAEVENHNKKEMRLGDMGASDLYKV